MRETTSSPSQKYGLIGAFKPQTRASSSSVLKPQPAVSASRKAGEDPPVRSSGDGTSKTTSGSGSFSSLSGGRMLSRSSPGSTARDIVIPNMASREERRSRNSSKSSLERMTLSRDAQALNRPVYATDLRRGHNEPLKPSTLRALSSSRSSVKKPAGAEDVKMDISLSSTASYKAEQQLARRKGPGETVDVAAGSPTRTRRGSEDGTGEERRKSFLGMIIPRQKSSGVDSMTRSSPAASPSERMMLSPYIKPSPITSVSKSVDLTKATDLSADSKPRSSAKERQKSSAPGSQHSSLRDLSSSANQQLHPELYMLLEMNLPKRTDALKYLFRKQASSPRGLVGLENLGNTCFMNSILQCIFSTELLMGYFMSGDQKAHVNSKSPMKGQLATAFAEAVKEVMKSIDDSGKVYNPAKLKRQIEYWAPQFQGYNQQDSQEFLRFMLDGLHEDLNRVTARPKYTYKDDELDKLSDIDKARISWARYHSYSSSLIFDIFGGQLQSTVTCHACGNLSTTFDAFWDLSLPIDENSRPCSIENCLSNFAKDETLEQPYKCSQCKSNQKASKRLTIYRCPEVLVLHLKRFSYTRYSRDKIETNVTFPLEKLSLEPVMSSTPGHDKVVTYDLFGVSVHMGGLGGGHYIAHCKNPDNGAWYTRNDRSVSRIDSVSSKFLSTSAYVLFFQKRRDG